MPRMARVVVPNFPHHVTQRGNRRQRVFFSDDDYRHYKRLLAPAIASSGCKVLAYCLMPNHVHLVIVPRQEDSLRQLFSEAHRRYTRLINFREGWRGHLWQERFHSFVMDERYLLAAVRYVELNPVKAQLCRSAEDWPWSSARAHLARVDDDLVRVKPMLDLVKDWQTYLNLPTQIDDDQIAKATRTGRPMGDTSFLNHVEHLTGVNYRLKKRGPKPKLK